MATKQTLVRHSTATSGSVSFLVGDAKSAAIRYVVKQGSAKAGSSNFFNSSNGSFFVLSNPDSNFTLTVGGVSATVTPDPYVAATATFTFSGKPNDGSKITIPIVSSGTDSPSLIPFEIDDSANGVEFGYLPVTGITAAGGGASGSAIALVNAINNSGITVTASNPSPGVVLLTQDTAGAVGNLPIYVIDRSHWDSVCSVNVPTAFTGGTNGVVANTATSIATALSGTNFSSLITATRGDSTTAPDSHVVFISAVNSGLAGNDIELSSSTESISVTRGGVQVNSRLRGGTSIFPSEGGTSTAIVNVYGTLLPGDPDFPERGSLLSSGDPSMGRAATDGLIVFSDDQFTGSLQHFHKITVTWESLSANADMTIICSKI